MTASFDDLVPVMTALGARDDQDPDRLARVRGGLVAALGEELARELCDGARSTSEIASRFFRLRARALLEDALKNHRR